MKVLVELNKNVEIFQVQDSHKKRLVEEFPHHEFKFVNSYAELKEKIAWAEAALVWVFPQHLFEKAVNLKSLYTPAAGKDWVAVDERGIVQSYFSSYHGHMIVESFMAMLLYSENNLAKTIENQGKSLWDRNAFGRRSLLRNKKLLILGYGSIGRICAEKALAFGMTVTGTCRNTDKESNCPLLPIADLSKFIGEYDFILNLLPGGESTEGFVSEKYFDLMKDGVKFFNFGRGSTVNEDDLVKALKSGKISFAGLDVFREEPMSPESELWGLDNVLITPHTSCCYEDYLHLFIDELKGKL